MATITLSVSAMSKSWTVSGADITRIVNALKPHYGQVFDPTLGGGSPPVGAMRDRTNQEVFDLVALGFINGIKNIVLAQEGKTASDTAVAAIVPVVAT